MILYKHASNSFYNDTDIQRYIDTENAKQRVSIRDDFERDFGRVVHSAAFRRLQSKTQVIGISEGDFHRTRLTHSLEVSQIARGIATTLNERFKEPESKIDISLIEAAALAHDLGHPPFGHQGERALNKCMSSFGLNFEGNAHTFRLLTNREDDIETGLDLTRAALLSILKYPASMKKVNNPEITGKPPKSSVFEEDEPVFEWVTQCFAPEEKAYFMEVTDFQAGKHRKTINKTFECSIIELADDIAYATYDLEDAFKLNLIHLDHLSEIVERHKSISSARIGAALRIFTENSGYKNKTKPFFADLVSGFINEIDILETQPSFTSNRLRYKAHIAEDAMQLLEDLKSLVIDHVIFSQKVQTFEWRGGKIIEMLFEAMINDKNLLPEDRKRRWHGSCDRVNARLVCDYIAGMTDTYALKMYSRLYEAAGGRLFDI
ncbi:anti-phage deoxyguanosine triphosphatase [Paenibacillus sp. PL91]|uniref:anti-phage deoxyguanosine triphosphatase n=1 Tax=Paenibacillus sp. PL91 TaxID=2729538 RepID=UPI00145C5C64|nr:anti-phage deoxyguanosine triphosphatase [Paenibacillus sp. PL91]MBC9201633.1 dGTPase [Paenibacillus sp. PL91]